MATIKCKGKQVQPAPLAVLAAANYLNDACAAKLNVLIEPTLESDVELTTAEA